MDLIFRAANGKFEQCVQAWNENRAIQFTVQLGDIIDGNETTELTEKDMQDALRVIGHCRLPMYHVIGNHCNKYNGGKPKVMEQLKMQPGLAYYAFQPDSEIVRESKHVFLVLDGTDISLNKWNPDELKSKEAEAWLEAHPIEQYSNAVNWNGAIGPDQLSWLEAELRAARQAKTKVWIFCHYPILADHMVMAVSLLWNAEEVAALLDRYDDVVIGWMSGHYHQGGAQMPSEKHKWAHITVEAILMAPEQSYGVVQVFERGATLEGTGSCRSHRWRFSS